MGLAMLNDDIAALQVMLADAMHRQKSFELRHHTAANRLKARSRTHDERINNALGRFEHYERKLEHMEGRVEAYDLGQQRNLDREFAELETHDHVEAELAALKERMGSGTTAAKE
jgi:phage shock protein A